MGKTATAAPLRGNVETGGALGAGEFREPDAILWGRINRRMNNSSLRR